MKDLTHSKRPSLILLKKTILSTFSSLTLFLLDILRWKAIKKELYQYCSFICFQGNGNHGWAPIEELAQAQREGFLNAGKFRMQLGRFAVNLFLSSS